MVMGHLFKKLHGEGEQQNGVVGKKGHASRKSYLRRMILKHVCMCLGTCQQKRRKRYTRDRELCMSQVNKTRKIYYNTGLFFGEVVMEGSTKGGSCGTNVLLPNLSTS